MAKTRFNVGFASFWLAQLDNKKLYDTQAVRMMKQT